MSKQTDYYVEDILDFDVPDNFKQVVYCAGRVEGVEVCDSGVKLVVPFRPLRPSEQHLGRLAPAKSEAAVTLPVYVRAYGADIVRITLGFEDSRPDDSGPILSMAPDLHPEPLSIVEEENGWLIKDSRGKKRLRIDNSCAATRKWSERDTPEPDTIKADIWPDATACATLSSHDMFTYGMFNSLPLGLIKRDEVFERAFFSVRRRPGEKFAGTGERFAEMDLSGRTILMENNDGAGVTSRRCYKCVPFFISSAGYGVFTHTHAHGRLSLGDVSTSAAQAVFDEGKLDLFLIGGGSVERILYHYRQLTGFPPEVPLWSYGMWMGRMTYVSAAETFQVADKLRSGGFPCDVLHVDPAWFPIYWKCDWQFSTERFPDPTGYFKQMREQGFRISLWQLPQFSEGTDLIETAREKRFLPPKKGGVKEPVTAGFGGMPGNHIDFTNPEAEAWYREQIRRLIQTGCAVIKADFGERIDPTLDYMNMSVEQLHNLYALLYQRACFEATAEVDAAHGLASIIWARAGWAGCQRYPVHWAGDSQCSWEGMHSTLRGGLHLGLSGYAYWAHDISGFCGIPDTMASWPSDALYVRWTQFGALSSHMRYHGCCPREPYEYPNVQDIVREWLKLRYALIPYLVEQARESVRSGYPLLRAMLLHCERDPNCWHIDDQYFLGEHLLVAPIFNEEGARRVYIPEGDWVDVWTGQRLEGPVWTSEIRMPLERVPVFARNGAEIPVYPEAVQHTGEMDLKKASLLRFHEQYCGLKDSLLGKYIALD